MEYRVVPVKQCSNNFYQSDQRHSVRFRKRKKNGKSLNPFVLMFAGTGEAKYETDETGKTIHFDVTR